MSDYHKPITLLQDIILLLSLTKKAVKRLWKFLRLITLGIRHRWLIDLIDSNKQHIEDLILFQIKYISWRHPDVEVCFEIVNRSVWDIQLIAFGARAGCEGHDLGDVISSTESKLIAKQSGTSFPKTIPSVPATVEAKINNLNEKLEPITWHFHLTARFKWRYGEFSKTGVPASHTIRQRS